MKGGGCLDVEERGTSTGGLVVWVSQHEGDVLELAGCPLVEVLDRVRDMGTSIFVFVL